MAASNEGELLRPSPVATSPSGSLPTNAGASPAPATPKGRGELQDVPVKHVSRLCCCVIRGGTGVQAKADVATELWASSASPRDKQRHEAREANRLIWEPVSNLLWTTNGARWSTFARMVVLLHVVGVANGAFNLYALSRTFERRLEVGLLILPFSLSCVVGYIILKAAHPHDGVFVRMCSFCPGSEKQFATNHKVARWVMIACTFTCVGAVALVIVYLAVDTFGNPKLERDQYGGYGGTWVGSTNFVLDLVLVCPMSVVFMTFLYLLITSSSVAVAAAEQVIAAIDRADQDVEADVSEMLRCTVGPCVQTLVEEILVPLSTGWGFAVAVSVVSCLVLAFVSLPTLIDVNSSPDDFSNALAIAISGSLSAVGLVYPPAMVTTVCEKISYGLNELRTAGVGTGKGMIHSDTDADICVIETWLSNLNRGQGPGFLLFGTVVSRRLLFTVASKVAGYVAVVVRALQEVQPQHGPVAVVDDQLGIGVYTMTVSAQGTSIVGPN